MNSNHVISSLCYFSIFFAGFILPIVVYFISQDPDVKGHAKSALLSHIVPFLSVILVFGLFATGAVISESALAGFSILAVLLFIAVNIGVVIWNVIKGIKVLTN